MTLEQFLADLKARKGVKGIATADAYLRSLSGCFTGGYCPQALFGAAAPSDWLAAIKASESHMTYHDEAMEIDSKAPNIKLSDAPADSAMVFSACLTSKKRDRDGDILEPSGCTPDQKMPLLWQHMPFEPIGRLIAITGQTDSRIMGQCAIASTELGRDAATLVKFGALRISHGFRPTQFEPLDDAKGPGWHVQKYEMMEVSLVSIPSNTDAVIDAWDTSKLAHPLVKSWAKGLFQGRPASAPGADFAELARKAAASKSLDGLNPKSGACGCGAKSADAKSVTAGDPAVAVLTKDYLTGSWQWIESKLNSRAAAFLSVNGIGNMQSDYAMVCGLYDNYGVIVRSYYSGSGFEQRYYRAGWSMVDAEPAWLGSPTEVQVTTEAKAQFVFDKAGKLASVEGVDGMGIKAGRALSRKNEDAIKEAADDCDEIAATKDCPRTIKALAKSASGKLISVLKSVTPDGEEEDGEDADSSMDKSVASVAVAYMAPASDADLDEAITALTTIRRARQYAKENEELNKLLGVTE